MKLAELDPHAAPAALVESRSPFLIGVRHHSAALAAVMPALLEAAAPTRLLIELPADLGAWLPWLGAAELQAPVALSATTPEGGLAFYPFADFSPELVAIRWAMAHGVPVEAIDRPVAARALDDTDDAPDAGRLLARLESETDELWDTWIESRAPAPPEALRRAALSFGWLLRADTLHGGGIREEDRRREGYMRACIQRALATPGARVCAVVGAFHANALLPTPVLETAPTPDTELVTPAPGFGALVPYDFELLDARSGYPAGVEDPALAQHAYECFSRGEGLEQVLPQLLVEIAHELRRRGHVASFADLREAARMAADLAALRGLRGPSRRELLQAIQSTMSQGEPLGRGRVLARALEPVLVGHRRGLLPAGAPRSGLLSSTEATIAELGLPGPRDKEGKELTLDPHRSALDRRRALLVGRLRACMIPYAEDRGGGLDGARARVETLTTRMRLRWTAETSARLELTAMFGSTPDTAADGVLRRTRHRLLAAGERVAEGWLELIEAAASAGLTKLANELLAELPTTFVPLASLLQLTGALTLCARLADDLIPTLPAAALSLAAPREALEHAAVRALDGIVGSTEDADVHALAELLGLLGSRDLATLRLALDRFADAGSPLMQGAGHVARAWLVPERSEELFTTFVSWFDLGVDGDPEAARVRSGLLRGALLLGATAFEADPRFSKALLEGLDRLDDARFLNRLPSLRAGFEVLSPAARARLLEELGAPLRSLESPLDDLALELVTRADRAARSALEALGLLPPPSLSVDPGEPTASTWRVHQISLVDRLRLLLGRATEQLAPSHARYGVALEALYGQGTGEGSSDRGGTGSAYPTAREWGDELRELFGERIREEVLGRAATAGNAAALTQLEPDHIVPSIDLLACILSLKGGLAESELEPLRRMAKHVVDALVRELASTVRPALTGLATPRATRRRVGPLDLQKTVQRNLDTAHWHEGTLRLAPRQFVFRTRAKRSLDWHVVLVVDVSGSMDPSVLHAAMMAGILGALPAVTTRFLTVNDRVVDLSDHVTDPLELLLSVQIGGGTLLSKGLRYARSLLRVPSRSMVVLVSDFEEGGSVEELLGEVRALVDGGSRVLGLAALGEKQAPRYHAGIAAQLVAAGMPIAALSPLELAGWVRDVMHEGRS